MLKSYEYISEFQENNEIPHPCTSLEKTKRFHWKCAEKLSCDLLLGAKVVRKISNSLVESREIIYGLDVAEQKS